MPKDVLITPASAQIEIKDSDGDVFTKFTDTAVGIGTATPSQLLHVDGDAKIDHLLGSKLVNNLQSDASFQFDGVDDIVTVDDSTLMENIFDGGGTISAWIKPKSDGEGGKGRIVANVQVLFYLRPDSGGTSCPLQLYYSFTGSGNTGTWTTGLDIKYGEWQHVAVIYNSDSTVSDTHLTLPPILLV